MLTNISDIRQVDKQSYFFDEIDVTMFFFTLKFNITQ